MGDEEHAHAGEEAPKLQATGNRDCYSRRVTAVRPRISSIFMDAFSFNGTLSLKQFEWRFFISFVLSAGSLVGRLFLELGPVFPILGGVVALSLASLIVRRLRDAGARPALVLWGLLPLIGWVYLAHRATEGSASGEEDALDSWNAYSSFAGIVLTLAILSFLWLLS